MQGWDAWDMAMLTQDARRSVSHEASEAAIRRYLELTGKSREAFDERLAVIGTLNALRITGTFCTASETRWETALSRFYPAPTNAARA